MRLLISIAAAVLLASCATYGPVADANDLRPGKTTKLEMRNAFGAPFEVGGDGVHLWIVDRTGADGWRTTINTYRIRATFDNFEVLKAVDVQRSSRPMQVLSAPRKP